MLTSIAVFFLVGECLVAEELVCRDFLAAGRSLVQ